jgi:hypothetical protein
VGLAQLVRFLVMELIHSGLVGGDVLIDSDVLIVIGCAYVYRGERSYVYGYLCLYCVSKKL